MSKSIAVLALVVSATSLALSVTPTKPPAPAAVRVTRLAWPSLGMDKTIVLGEALKKLGTHDATIYCGNPDCRDLMHDVDDALQIAGWDSDFYQDGSPASLPPGLYVGPKGAEGVEDVAAAIATATGVTPQIIPTVPGRIAIVLAKRPKN
jgi:hypothetical protein